jgi:UDP-2,3-diacylglucosamine pyrophosphatase LpxH
VPDGTNVAAAAIAYFERHRATASLVRRLPPASPMSSFRHVVGVALVSTLLVAGVSPVPAHAYSRAPRSAPSLTCRPGSGARAAKAVRPARSLRTRVLRTAVRLRRVLRSVGREIRGTRQQPVETPTARAEANRLHRQFADRERVLADQAADAHVAEVTAFSRRGGRYLVVSDLHWGRGRTLRGWWPGEDFRQDEAFVNFVTTAAADSRPTTLILNGDWLELIRHVDYDTPIREVERHVQRIVRGHEREVRALTDAVANRGLRVLYTRGNHDVTLVDPRVRQILMAEMIRVGGLVGSGADRFRQRFAWSGHAAVIGASGEGLVFHGDLMDSINNWRSPVNPYDGYRKLEPNLGWQIVSTLLRPIQLLDRAMTEREKVTAVFKYLRRTVDSRSAAGLLLRALIPIPRSNEGERLAAQDDDRVAMRAWLERTGVGGEEWARAFEKVVDRSPEPILDRLRSNKWGINVGRVFAGFIASMFTGSRRERLLVDRLGELPNVRYAIWGHTHQETTLSRPHPTKGAVQYVGSGTWTRMDKGWPLDVVVATTDGDGALKLDGLHRAQRSGELAAVPLAELTRPRSRWQRAFRRPRPSSTPMLPATDQTGSAAVAAAQ